MLCRRDGERGEGGGDNERAILTRGDVTAAGLMKGTDQRIRCDLGVESTISVCLGILPFKRGMFWVGGVGGGLVNVSICLTALQSGQVVRCFI